MNGLLREYRPCVWAAVTAFTVFSGAVTMVCACSAALEGDWPWAAFHTLATTGWVRWTVMARHWWSLAAGEAVEPCSLCRRPSDLCGCDGL